MPNVTLLSATPDRKLRRGARLPRRTLLVGMPAAALALGAALVVERRQGPAASGSGPVSLVVTSQPSGATVLVDGRRQGPTPAQLALLPGAYAIKVEQPGVIPNTVQVQTTAGRLRQLSVALWRSQPSVQRLRAPFPGSAISSADFLADGRVALGITLPPGTVQQLWCRDDAGRLAQLGPGQAAGPLAVAPDGRSVGFLAPAASQPADTSGLQRLTTMWTSGADGSALQRRYALPASAATARLDLLSWAPAGSHLLLVRSDPAASATRAQLLWLDLARGSMQQLVELPAAIVPGSFLWSPSGDRVAFLTQANALVSLCLLGISPPSFRYLTDLSRSDASPLPYPPLAWSGDSTQVVYAAPVPAPAHGLGDLLLGSHTADALFRTAASGTQSVRLGSVFGGAPTWRPDDSILALVPPAGGSSMQWEALDPTTGVVQTQASVVLPTSGAMALRWDTEHRQALLAGRSNGTAEFWLLSFAAEVN